MPTIVDQILTLPTASIVVGDRQRSATDVTALAESISRLGQLHPIIIHKDYRLVAGFRRLQACAQLGMDVRARVYEDLSPTDAKVVELEENLKRQELPWRDRVNAIGELDALYRARDPEHTQAKLSQAIGLSESVVSQMLTLYENRDTPIVAAAQTSRVGYNKIMRQRGRAAEAAIEDLLRATDEPEGSVADVNDCVLTADFVEWVGAYSGPRFNLIHCDLPYGVNVFGGPQGRQSNIGTYDDAAKVADELAEALFHNLERVMADSAHMLFWFSMKYYNKYLTALRSAGLTVDPFPLVWMKSDNKGIAPDPTHTPRRGYETALFCYRGDRPLVQTAQNAFYGPTEQGINATVKPQSMLAHFLKMLVDGNTTLLDPTCGTGTALCAAHALGAKSVLGLERNAEKAAYARDNLRSVWHEKENI